MMRSVFVAGVAVGVLALGGIAAAAGDAHPSALTHLGKSGASGEDRAGSLTPLTQGLNVTTSEAQDATQALTQANAQSSQAQAQGQTQAQSDTQDEDTTENDDAAENGSTEADDAAEQAAEQASEQAPPAPTTSAEQDKGEGSGGGD